ncbi:preprotein translocase subunit SecG [Pokkaliibacter sp. CJK22405]|uniref:preprotein translocase subunit SecG n=1 Tax=Pokkaliibacter sp. CJK22405 TaxID=3384615 RepID=UPI0039850C32
METLVIVVHVALAVSVIALVLLQQGKGADAGAAFGSGASQTVFGSQGSGSFLVKMTAGLAAAFFVTSFALAYFAKEKVSDVSAVGMPSADVIKQVEQNTSAPSKSVNDAEVNDLPSVGEDSK